MFFGMRPDMRRLRQKQQHEKSDLRQPMRRYAVICATTQNEHGMRHDMRGSTLTQKSTCFCFGLRHAMRGATLTHKRFFLASHRRGGLKL